jgi:S-DNA-T family DNA segregation ATPase FtsK/SpoIIIE
MARTATKPRTKKKASSPPPPKRRGVGAIVCLFLAVFAFLGYVTADGIFVNFFGSLLRGLFGAGFHLAAPCLLLAAGILAAHKGRPVTLRTVSALILPLPFGAVLHLLACKTDYSWGFSLIPQLWTDAISGSPPFSGGIIAGLTALASKALFSSAGALIVLITLSVVLLFAAANLTPASLLEAWRNRERREYEEYIEPPKPEPVLRPASEAPRRKAAGRPVVDIPLDNKPEKTDKPDFTAPNRKPADFSMPQPLPEAVPVQQTVTVQAIEPELPPLEVKPKLSKSEIAQAGAQIAASIETSDISDTAYSFPPLSLLSPPAKVPQDAQDEVAENTMRLAATLRNFGIDAEIVNATRGPSVTRFELELDEGVKLNKLTALSEDIALSLGALGVRIAPVVGKNSIVGIEVPNKLVTTVFLREILESQAFRHAASALTFAVGKDIAGNAVAGDIAKYPHLLIAGTTGSGKSVCINSLIISLLYKSAPEDVRLIMIDPKMVELGIYNGIPHLLIPVVTDPKKAAGALQWAVYEMMKRYKLFSDVGARDLAGYNEALLKEKDSETQKLPQIVVLIDELADLMLVAAKEVEESILRIAQMGRASGIHLVVATQRPSRDIVTGVIKSNIPSRIAFAVSSHVNSSIILDTKGAEKLVGKGDMLYLPLGAGKPLRVQGAVVTDSEREDVIDFIKAHTDSQYSEDIVRDIEARSNKQTKASSVNDPDVFENEDMFEGDAFGGVQFSGGSLPQTPRDTDDVPPFPLDNGIDDMFNEAVNVFLDTGQASVSMLQRRLKLGYGRASRIVDQMEERGIVGPFEGSKPRQLLVTREEWEAR